MDLQPGRAVDLSRRVPEPEPLLQQVAAGRKCRKVRWFSMWPPASGREEVLVGERDVSSRREATQRRVFAGATG